MIEPSTDFVYPNDEPINTPHGECLEFSVRLLTYILPSNDPRLLLTALCYANGMDLTYLLGCDENTEADIARSLGVTRGAFSKAVKLVMQHFIISHNNLGKSKTTYDKYRKSNFRFSDNHPK